MKILKAFGDFMSTVILIIFYFTVFALFAVPFRLFADPLGTKPAMWSNLKQKKQSSVTLAWLQKEF